MREKELKTAKAQLQKRDATAARAAEAEAALAAANAEVRRAISQHRINTVIRHISHDRV